MNTDLKKKHIAYMGIKGLPYSGGAERVVDAIVRNLDHERYEATIYCNERLIPETAVIPHVNLVRLPSLPGKHLQSLSFFVSSLVHALFKGNYDVIHLHNVDAAFVLPFLRRKYRVIATSHGQAQTVDKWGGPAKKFFQLMERPFTKLPNEITSVSSTLATYYEEQYGRRAHYIPNGVNPREALAHERLDDALHKVGLTPGYILFAAGRIVRIKGCHLLLEAYQGIDGARPELVVIGDTSQSPAYEHELLQKAGESVTFVPFVSEQETLFAYVKACRFFVFPSLVEAMSMMLLEVASLGVPIICSDIPANLAVLEGHALFFKSGDAADLRRKMEWALTHSAEMTRMAAGAKRHVEESFGWPIIVQAYQDLYD